MDAFLRSKKEFELGLRSKNELGLGHSAPALVPEGPSAEAASSALVTRLGLEQKALDSALPALRLVAATTHATTTVEGREHHLFCGGIAACVYGDSYTFALDGTPIGVRPVMELDRVRR